MAVCGRNAPPSVHTLHEILLPSPCTSPAIEAQIHCIAETCEPILQSLDKFKSYIPCTLQVFDIMEELQLHSSQVPEQLNRFHTIDELQPDQRTKNLEVFASAFRAAADELLEYLARDMDGQPSIGFLRGMRIIDLKRVPFQSQLKGLCRHSRNVS